MLFLFCFSVKGNPLPYLYNILALIQFYKYYGIDNAAKSLTQNICIAFHTGRACVDASWERASVRYYGVHDVLCLRWIYFFLSSSTSSAPSSPSSSSSSRVHLELLWHDRHGFVRIVSTASMSHIYIRYSLRQGAMGLKQHNCTLCAMRHVCSFFFFLRVPSFVSESFCDFLCEICMVGRAFRMHHRRCANTTSARRDCCHIK